MGNLIQKVKDWFASKTGKRVVKRAGFVLMHAGVAGIIVGLLAIVDVLVGAYATYATAAVVALILMEFGELKGRAKEAGTFENNVESNLELFADTNDDVWSLLQTVGAVIVFLAVFEVVKWVV